MCMQMHTSPHTCLYSGHSSRPEDANQPQAAPRPLPKEPSLQDMGTSGEYCEIDIITGQSDEEQKYMQARKNVGVRRTQCEWIEESVHTEEVYVNSCSSVALICIIMCCSL